MIKQPYLFGEDLTKAVIDLIKEAEKELWLISPYIAISHRVRDALLQKLNENRNSFQINVLFGKNGMKELSKGKLPKLQESLQFFMQFPNCEIRFEERLHAKFYRNETHMIFSSMNLYDFSESKNIEFGVLEKHKSRRIIGKTIDAINKVQEDLIEKVADATVGIDNLVNPIEEFKAIFDNAELVYESKAILESKTGLGSKLLGSVGIEQKQIGGSDVKADELTHLFIGNSKSISQNAETRTKSIRGQLLSATALGKPLNLSFKDVVAQLSKQNYISPDGKQVLDLGKQKGIQLKKSDKGEWLVYPEQLMNELNSIK